MNPERFIKPEVRGIEISGIRKMANLVAKYPDALSLTIGQPDFPTPAHIVEAGKRALDEGRTGYTANPGMPELRQAAAAFVADKYGLFYRWQDEVIVTVGASEALDMTLRAIVCAGDEVILPGPIYPGYEPLVRMAGGVPVTVDTRADGFRMTAEALEAAITPRTKAVLLCSPANPTGRSQDRASLEKIAAVLRGRDLVVISDEIYSELLFDGEHVSIASLPDMRERTVVINGLSKSHSMTGWRIGFAFAPAWLAEHLVKVHQYNVTCATSVSQCAAIAALTAGRDDALPMREAYRRRRDYVCDRLVAMGMEIHRPEGAFYVFPSIARFGLSSQEFAHRLLERERVAVVPGDAFGPLGEGYIRLSYAYSEETLREGLDRLEKFLRSLDGGA
ncbi:aminotransferase A [Paenibacillus thermoaerophilus]|uniref:Aminotransferase n=1 Tax=Paenibacillus thermoaerophilus TaxID=1215385 RepID=A0ABW2UXS0_9BACL|nr:aminotransferase A [Paenibacillus thermoaerophilus]TMV19097.1 aminotransferase A [Paenibacillus thermoaerophilus]